MTLYFRQFSAHAVHQVVVPKVLCKATIKLVLDSLFPFYLGISRMYQKFKDLFYFPNMMQDVKAYVTACLSFDSHTTQGATSPQVSAPFEVSADLVDCGQSSSGLRCI